MTDFRKLSNKPPEFTPDGQFVGKASPSKIIPPSIGPSGEPLNIIKSGLPPKLPPEFRNPVAPQLFLGRDGLPVPRGEGKIPPKIKPPMGNTDLRDATEDDILRMLSNDEKIPLYIEPNKYKTVPEAWDVYDDIMGQEDKLYRALNQGILKNHPHLKDLNDHDAVMSLAEIMGAPKPKFVSMENSPSIGGSFNTMTNELSLNPSFYESNGRESIIAHELRHAKERSSASSLRDLLNSDGDEWGAMKNGKRGNMKILNIFNKKKERLFSADNTKPAIDALDYYKIIEKDHFVKEFLQTNLKRVAKGLPPIAIAAGILGSDDASAALGMVPVVGEAFDAERAGETDQEIFDYRKDRATTSPLWDLRNLGKDEGQKALH